MWKIGIISFIRITQSKVRPIENLAFLMISAIFEMSLLWTAWPKWSLWYQFSTQNLMPCKFHLIGLAKFRQVAILAVFWGYFGYFLSPGYTNIVETYLKSFSSWYLTICHRWRLLYFPTPPSRPSEHACYVTLLLQRLKEEANPILTVEYIVMPSGPLHNAKGDDNLHAEPLQKA